MKQISIFFFTYCCLCHTVFGFQIYEADLRAVPNALSLGQPSGKATFTINDNTLSVTIVANNLPKDPRGYGTVHMLSLYERGYCPISFFEELSIDDIFDPIEFSYLSGRILIPLDSDLKTQFADLSDLSVYPISFDGTLSYNNNVLLDDLYHDLYLEDNDKWDYVTKLPKGEPLNLEGKAVVIHGVPEYLDLTYMNTIKSIHNLPINNTMIVACGLLKNQK